ncbi:MAG: hypothetical protein HYZ44_14570 [Bacteroidetes bacterium]|nr:hypothetical protein [Bacteroidota bacterium]
MRKSELKNSQLILIADVLPTTGQSQTYKVKILEILKGEAADSILTGKILSSCSHFPSEGRWIIYARDLKDGAIEIRQCGLSRPILNPDRGPFIKRYLITDRVKSLKRAQRDLQHEIDILRRRKMNQHKT